ncbi:hypothetical protein Nepgr_023517 [Nepenthes gracilis]|uniref:Glycosyltransferase n=1 Tax=Nepenthes gracilis TaxID=150966 RepID=A0AAD3XZ68_NEPGR|nr:hypothetical protein Nepgr_023517 [Nepenthes gracilis]
MRKAELIFIPMPGMGHLIPAVAMAKRLVERDEGISITILIVNLQFYLHTPYIQSLESDAAIDKRIRFILLPQLDKPFDTSSRAVVTQMILAYRPIIKQTVEERVIKSDSAGQLAGFVLDLFCTGLIDLANELNVPSYIFFTSGAALLSLMWHFQSLRDYHGVDVTEFQDSNAELDIPGVRYPVPCKVLPTVLLEKDAGAKIVLDHAKRYREAKGIIVNTFMELESHSLNSLSKDADIPPIYPVGPIITLDPQNIRGAGNGSHGNVDSIMRWLDDQPPASVVFLCFGSMGSFSQEQARQIATALERSGHRFLWSLRRAPTADEKVGPPRDYENLDDVLPDGFLDRTAGTGKVIGWAPQVEILSHPAVGSFVSHCGWNSTLESLWSGVPMAAWPMYAEQQLNAFQLVRELGLAAEVRMHYRWDNRKKVSNGLVEAEEIEKAIRKVMDADDAIRSKFKEMSEASRKAMAEGGSSYAWLGRLIEEIFESIYN